MLSSMPVVPVWYPHKRSVLASYRVTGASLSLFVPTTNTQATLGAEVRLEISFGDCARTFSFSGQVTWRRSEPRSPTMEPGLGVSFRGREKYEAAQMLAFCAGKPLSLGTADDPRYPTEIECTVQMGNREFAAQVRDLSSSGAFIASTLMGNARVGSPVTLVLRPGWFGLAREAYEATVVWAGDQKGIPGCGTRFVEAAPDKRKGLKRYLVPGRTRRRA